MANKITKRKDGRYQANVITGIDESTGKRKYKTVYSRSPNELKSKVADVRSDVNKGVFADDKNTTLGAWANKWFLTYRATSQTKTKEMYDRLVYSHIIPSLGDIRLRDLKKTDIQEIINYRSDHPRTCQQIKMCINQILESAIDEGLLYKNVCRNVILPKQIKEEKRPLTEIEKKAVQKADLDPKERAFIYIILYTGLRRGEALALSQNDIDFSSNEIRVRNAVTHEGNSAKLKTMPKTTAGIRNVPMPSILRDFLLGYIKSLNGLYLFEMERKGGLMTKSSYIKFWRKIVDKLNASVGGTETIRVIHGLGAHAFRHNYATMLFYAGVKEKEAQYMLGHSDIKITLDIYTHLDKSKNTTAEKLDKFLAL